MDRSVYTKQSTSVAENVCVTPVWSDVTQVTAPCLKCNNSNSNICKVCWKMLIRFCSKFHTFLTVQWKNFENRLSYDKAKTNETQHVLWDRKYSYRYRFLLSPQPSKLDNDRWRKRSAVINVRCDCGWLSAAADKLTASPTLSRCHLSPLNWNASKQAAELIQFVASTNSQRLGQWFDDIYCQTILVSDKPTVINFIWRQCVAEMFHCFCSMACNTKTVDA